MCLGPTRYSSAAKACPRLPSSYPNTTMLSSHRPYTTTSLSRPPASPEPVSWCWRPHITPDTCVSGSGDCPAPSLRLWPANCPKAPPPPTPPFGAPPPDRPPSRPDIVTVNVQMSLRPKLRLLDVLIREYQYPLTLHIQEAGPLIVQRVHPLYHTIQAPAKVAGGYATLLCRAPDLAVTSHSAHPSGRALVTPFTVAGVTHCHANVYFPADGDLDSLQEILDSVYPYGTEMRDGTIHLLRGTVFLNGHPVRCAAGQDYVRVLGRCALPHLFHHVDSRRLFSGARTACRALRAPKLPAHHPLAMFVAKCHGTVNWYTSVPSPSY